VTRIGITDTLKPSLKHYVDWLQRFEPKLEYVLLSHLRQNLKDIDTIDGLLLTGGGDIDPMFYDADDPLGYSREINHSRDEFEFFAIDRALEREIPILGICRGMQVMNVYLGGTLVLDLPSAGYDNHSSDDKYGIAHQVEVISDTLLAEITNREVLSVNSSHHQAVQRLGGGLMASAVSPDGVIEAAEWAMKDRAPYCCLVQWHPERMKMDFDSPASRAIAERFLDNTKHPTTTNTLNTTYLATK
jgi:putative glutamine amidotransferase